MTRPIKKIKKIRHSQINALLHKLERGRSIGDDCRHRLTNEVLFHKQEKGHKQLEIRELLKRIFVLVDSSFFGFYRGVFMLIGLLQFFFAFSYIASNNSFPSPLTAEEEEAIFKRFKDGDNEARDILITRNLRLVAHVVKRYTNHSKEAEDLLSVGNIGLIKAIDSFSYEKGTRFATYASRCINNSICIQR